MHQWKCCGCDTVKTPPDDFSVWLANRASVKYSASARCNECKASSLAAEKRQRQRKVSLVVKESDVIFRQYVDAVNIVVCTAVQGDQLM